MDVTPSAGSITKRFVGRSMKNLLVTFLFLFTHANGFCAENEPIKNHPFPERDGRFALIFSFDELDLSSFDGGIGLKYWLTDDWSLRGSISAGLSDRTLEGDRTDNFSGAGGVTVGVEKHFGSGRFSPFCGGGLGYRLYGSTSSKRNYSDRVVETENIAHQAIGQTILGAEFWLSEHFSLTGAYVLAVTHSTNKRKTIIDPALGCELYEQDIDEFRDTITTLSVGTTTLTLSVYF